MVHRRVRDKGCLTGCHHAMRYVVYQVLEEWLKAYCEHDGYRSDCREGPTRISSSRTDRC